MGYDELQAAETALTQAVNAVRRAAGKRSRKASRKGSRKCRRLSKKSKSWKKGRRCSSKKSCHYSRKAHRCYPRKKSSRRSINACRMRKGSRKCAYPSRCVKSRKSGRCHKRKSRSAVHAMKKSRRSRSRSPLKKPWKCHSRRRMSKGRGGRSACVPKGKCRKSRKGRCVKRRRSRSRSAVRGHSYRKY